MVSYSIGYMNGRQIMDKYSNNIRWVICWDCENNLKYIFFTNAFGKDDD